MLDVNASTYSSSRVIKHYDEYGGLQAPEKTIWQILRPELAQMKMLDIGVGGGRTTPYFAPKVKEYVAIDFSKGMIDVCREKFKTTLPAARFDLCDVRDLSRYPAGYFDFVLFSFNGLDYISEDERLRSLHGIRRVTAPRGYFCFSSHNLQSLPAFLAARCGWHPVRLLKALVSRRRLIRLNRTQIAQLPTADQISIYDDVYDFGLNTFYVRPRHQVETLRRTGFGNVRLFGLTTGAEMNQPSEYNSAIDPWIYYLCR